MRIVHPKDRMGCGKRVPATTLRVLEDRMRALLRDVERVVGRERVEGFLLSCLRTHEIACKICGDEVREEDAVQCAGCLAEVCEKCVARRDEGGDAWCVFCTFPRRGD